MDGTHGGGDDDFFARLENSMEEHKAEKSTDSANTCCQQPEWAWWLWWGFFIFAVVASLGLAYWIGRRRTSSPDI